ncbi:hypothetical protein F4680DRAFT_150149 [Xylaria scruposa]|nr:hypothetical protein F4680DRAFT_150149 [Xylaria scruposa]
MSHKSQPSIDLTEHSGSLALPSQECCLHGEMMKPGVNYNDTDNGEVYPSSQSTFQESQYSNQTILIRPASRTSEESHNDHVHKGTRSRSRIKGWSLEMIGLLLTLVAFISLLAVLKKVDNQPLSTWHFPFSVNTVVSSLSVVIKTPLAFAVGSCLGQGKWSWFTKRPGPLFGFVTFDDASRGPLGCVALLWWLKSRYWASLGAWVTLLLLGVDPFWQAVIQYDGKLVSTEYGDSMITTSEKLNIGDWYHNSTAYEDYHGMNDVQPLYQLYPEISILATLLIAMVNSSASGSTQPPGISCRTGNCTWPLYTSLGMCSTCFDITEQVTKEQDVGIPNESKFSSCFDSSSGLANNYINHYTSYVLPYPGGRRIILQNTNGFVDQASCRLRSRVGLSAAFQPSDTYNFKNSQTLLASFALLELSSDYWNNDTTLEKATPKATECALEFCALAYEAQMKNGIPTETIVSRSSEKLNNSYSPSGNLSPETRGYIWQDFGDNLLSSSYEAFELENSATLTEVIPRYDLQVTLSDIGPDVLRVFNFSQKSIVTMANNLYQNTTLESMTYAISDTMDVTQTFDDAARLLTYRMREMDGSYTLGFSEQWTIFIHVRWNFIIFPVIVLISGYIFTIGAVIDSDRLALKTMKSDTIATLLWGLDLGTRQFLRFEEQQYNSCSDKFMVKLTTDVDGLQLRAL